MNSLEKKILEKVKKFPAANYEIANIVPDKHNLGMDVHFESKVSISGSGVIMGTGIGLPSYTDKQKVHVDYPSVTTSIDFGKVMKEAGSDMEANWKVVIVERGMGAYIT